MGRRTEKALVEIKKDRPSRTAFNFLMISGGADGARTRDLQRDRLAF